MDQDKPPSRFPLRTLVAAAFLLSLPMAAMQLTEEVNWAPGDFVLAGTLLAGTGLLYHWAAGSARSPWYRAAAGLALAAALLLVWINLAVGIIGSEDDRANLMYIGVLAVGGVGAAAARFRPRGMALALVATAVAQALVTGIALSLELGAQSSPPLELLGVNAIFVALYLGSAWLFLRAAGDRSPAGSRR